MQLVEVLRVAFFMLIFRKGDLLVKSLNRIEKKG